MYHILYTVSMLLDTLLFSRHMEVGEKIVWVIHKHWLVGMKFLLWPSVSFLLSWYTLYLAPIRPVFYLVSLWSIGSLVWWLRNFLDYYLDAWIVTTHGIIDLAWHGWFHRQSTRVLYSDVHGVSTEVCGITATLLRYGTVSVEKISTGSTISLSHVPRPRQVEAHLLREMETYVHGKNLKDAKHVQELLSNFIAEKVQLDTLQTRGKKTVSERTS